MNRPSSSHQRAAGKAKSHAAAELDLPTPVRISDQPPVMLRKLSNCVSAVLQASRETGVVRDPFDLLQDYRAMKERANASNLPFELRLWVLLDRLDQVFADVLTFSAADYVVPPTVSDVGLPDRSDDQALPKNSPYLSSRVQSVKERVGISDRELDIAVRAYRERKTAEAVKAPGWQAQVLALDWDTKARRDDLAELDVLLEFAQVEQKSPDRLLSSPLQSALQSKIGKGQRRGESDKYNHEEIRSIGKREGWLAAPARSRRRTDILDLIIKQLNLIPSIRGAKANGKTRPVNLDSVKKNLRRILDSSP